jgi:hypothetical protein
MRAEWFGQKVVRIVPNSSVLDLVQRSRTEGAAAGLAADYQRAKHSVQLELWKESQKDSLN